MTQKTIYLVDGENIVLRYQTMLSNGKKPKSDVIHNKDSYVWHPEITTQFCESIFRVSFYTTLVGDHPAIERLCDEISEIKYTFQPSSNMAGSGTLNPFVFKKERRSTKTKSVDINLTIDALRHTYNNDVERIVICSGDGDYIPLIKELMRHGVTVRVLALSEGCHPSLKHIPDDFYFIDDFLFDNDTEQDEPLNKSSSSVDTENVQ